jgi:hypothetical protein
MPLLTEGEPARRVAELLMQRGAAATASAESVGNPADGVCWLGGPLREALTRRRSVRDFAADPLPCGHLRAIIADARAATAATWPGTRHGDTALTVMVAADRVTGLAEGVHAAGPGQWLPLAKPGRALLGSLAVEYADAPALLLVCGDLAQISRVGGGYGDLLVRAGTLGYAAWLRAISLGLGGSIYGGTSPQVTAVARQAGAGLQHVFTVAIGHPAVDQVAP